MSEPILRIEHLHKEYNQNVILKDFNLDVKRGEVIVIIGPSGCGKSTLLRCINGLENIQSGDIQLEHRSIVGDTKIIEKERQRIGMVFQSYDLFPHKTVLENITLAPRKVQKRNKQETEAEGLELLNRVGLAAKQNAYPRQLSGGQRQRVAIVRALAMHPEVMLFDEVTAALDPEMVHEVLETMLELARSGKTMLIVTHEMSFARAVADRIVFIDGGELVEEGAPEDFFLHPRTERARKFLQSFEYHK